MKNYQLLIITTIIIACRAQPTDEQPQSTHPVWSKDGSKIAFINNAEGVQNDHAI